jgi:hypothetical protein
MRSIGDYAFYQCSALQTVSISGRVETIGDYAFYECPITTVTIEGRVETIGQYAFSQCLALEEVIIQTDDAKETTIKSYAFEGCCFLEWLTIGATVKCIEPYAFVNCEWLRGGNPSFENTSGWWVSKKSTATSGESLTWKTMGINNWGTYLVVTYVEYYWRCDS